jgi:hypothetical protein
MMNTSSAVKNIFLMLMLVVISVNCYAEQVPFKVVEIASLSIKLSKDGTGIVKNIRCKGCSFNFVKITKNSKASVQGAEVSILEARNRAGKQAMVSFTPETQEVQYIRW